LVGKKLHLISQKQPRRKFLSAEGGDAKFQEPGTVEGSNRNHENETREKRKEGKMNPRKFALGIFLAVVSLALVAGSLQAAPTYGNLLTNSDFQDFTGPFTLRSLDVTDNTTYNTWFTSGHWNAVQAAVGTNIYAQHIRVTPVGTTDILFQLIPLSPYGPVACVGENWMLKLSFTYVNVDYPFDVVQPKIHIYGFPGGAGTWSRFAPWPLTPPSGPNQPVLLYGTTLPNTPTNGQRSNFSTTFTLPQHFNWVAVGFEFGFQGGASTDRNELLDNVVLQAIAPASVNIDPDTLNLKSKGQFITAYITLPECLGKSGSDINPDTVRLVSYDSTSIGLPAIPPFDVEDGVLMVKFDRQQLIEILNSNTGTFTFNIEGNLYDGTGFYASDTIVVIKPGS
jgi:hypothetical protein